MNIGEIVCDNIRLRGRGWIELKTIEECSELITALVQSETKGGSVEHIQEEIAHVEVALYVLTHLYNREKIEEEKKKKWEQIEKANKKIMAR